jgi:DNA-directed RNA polymerase delta subunit
MENHMNQLTFIELAKKVVGEQQKPMTSDEIWKTAVEGEVPRCFRWS